MAQPMLALPSAEQARKPSVVVLAAALGGAGVLTGFGALIAAWVNLHHFNHPWPPKGVVLVNYPGTMLSVTVMMAIVTAHWGVWAVRRDLRGQAAAGLAFTAGFILAFINLLWFFGRDLHVGARSSPFAIVIDAVLAVAGVAAAVGVAAMLAVLVRVIGRQDRLAVLDASRAAAIFWDFVAVGWLFVTIFVWRPISL